MKAFNIYSRQQRDREMQISAVRATDTAIHINTLIRPAGQVAFDVEFPIHFTERPSVAFGWEFEEGTVLHQLLDSNTNPPEDDFPDCSAYILSWTSKSTPDVGQFSLYAGARIGTRVAFRDSSHASVSGLILHASFTGSAIQAPDRGDI